MRRNPQPAWVVVVVVCAVAALSAQQARPVPQQPQQQTPVFRAKTEIIQIDVTVLGPDGRPLTGLMREDFTLLEDGEPQPILGFGEVRIPGATDGPPWLRDSSPDVRTALDGRVLVFLLDDAQASYDINNERWIATVKRTTGDIIDRMGPRDVAAVVCVYDKRCDQDFTNDPARLRAAVSQFRPKSAFIAYRVSAGMAQSVTKFLGTEKNRRRTIIYVTPRMPVRPAFIPHLWSIDQQQLVRTFEQAAKDRVTVYGLSLTGLSRIVAADNEPDDLVTPRAAAAAAAPARSAPFSAPERSLPAETGGFMLSRPDQYDEGLDQIFRETGSYYLLGYEQPPKKDTGYNMLKGFRELEVRVNRPGLTVKTHRGYTAVEPPKPVPNPPPAATTALSGILPKSDLPLRLTLAPFALPNRSEAIVAVALGVRQPTPTARTMDRIDLQVRAFTQGGAERAIVWQKIDAAIPTSRETDVLLEVVTELKLKPGVYAIRAAATSDRMGVSGSVYADIEIPNYAKAPLSLSGVLLTSVPRPPTAQAAPLNAIIPGPPTTLRAFDRTHIVSTFLRVYQGDGAPPKPVNVVMTVLDPSGALVMQRALTLTADRFAKNRSADLSLPIVATELAPGAHLLRIEAASGATTVRRDVQFLVR